MKFIARSLFGIGVAFAALASAGAAQDPTLTPFNDDTPVKVVTEEIKLNVSAYDRFGEFVSGVSKDDLVIVEDGRLHQPTSVRRIPANVLIMLDTGGEQRQVKNISRTRNVAKELVRRLNPGNSLAVLEYSDKARILTEWTTNKFKVLEDLDRKLIFGRRSMFSDALNLAARFLSNSELENRHLVIVSDGTDSFWSDDRREAEMRTLLGTNINVHVISYTALEKEVVEERSSLVQKTPAKKAIPEEIAQTLPNGVRDTATAPNAVTVTTDAAFIKTLKDREKALEKGEEYLLKLATDTSGLFILPETPDEMTEKAYLIANVIDSNYVVTYVPKRPLSESEPGETRVIEVSSKKPGLRVLAKRKLIVGEEAQ
ncbi:MAG TPA: VWA domain-containing protein [Aridibacter sp.]|nr:VWA domain-containing protein [Aridibacter sp.]